MEERIIECEQKIMETNANGNNDVGCNRKLWKTTQIIILFGVTARSGNGNVHQEGGMKNLVNNVI